MLTNDSGTQLRASIMLCLTRWEVRVHLLGAPRLPQGPALGRDSQCSQDRPQGRGRRHAAILQLTAVATCWTPLSVCLQESTQLQEAWRR